MTPGEGEELYVLAKEFGLSAHEALFVRPAWEIDNLLSEHARRG